MDGFIHELGCPLVPAVCGPTRPLVYGSLGVYVGPGALHPLHTYIMVATPLSMQRIETA